jgi:hypothetical protein
MLSAESSSCMGMARVGRTCGARWRSLRFGIRIRRRPGRTADVSGNRSHRENPRAMPQRTAILCDAGYRGVIDSG